MVVPIGQIRKRVDIILDIEQVLEEHCRPCEFSGSNKSTKVCDKCEHNVSLLKLGAEMENRKAKKQRRYEAWTPEQEATAVEMKARGATNGNIGKAIGRKTESVSKKLQKMKKLKLR